MIRDIAGRHNPSVKLARKLQKKKHRRERGLLVGEGMDLLWAACDAGVDVFDVLVRRELVGDLPPGLVQKASSDDRSVRDRTREGGPSIGICGRETLNHASSLGGAADVVFVCPLPAWSLSDLNLSEGVALFLAGVGDPGNVGTLVRGCAAFRASGLICSPGTADPYGPKALRGGMGAQFKVPVVIEVTAHDLEAHFERMVKTGARKPEVLVADPHRGQKVVDRQTDQGVLVVLGTERGESGEDWGSAPRVTIPQSGFESLNVAMAGTILLYELSRESAGK